MTPKAAIIKALLLMVAASCLLSAVVMYQITGNPLNFWYPFYAILYDIFHYLAWEFHTT